MNPAALIALAALGGGVGAALRYAVDEAVTARWRRGGSRGGPRDFPLGIFLVNVTGSLALGLLVGLLAGPAASPGWFALLGTGLLGGYTTFSTASLDAVRLARSGRVGTALVYGVGTMVATISAAVLGLWLGGLSTTVG